jgi:Flp pilus assembly protein TadD
VKPAYPDPLVAELHSLQRGARYHFEQAMVAVNQGDDAKAVAEFAAGLAEAPDNARARTSYGRSLWIAGEHEAGLAELRRAAADGPQETLPRFLLAAAAEAAGDPAAAERGYREVIALDPRHQGALSYLGGLKLRQGDYAAAAQAYGAAIEAGANQLPIYLHYWGALRGAGRPLAELRSELEAFDQRFPEPPLFRFLLAKLLASSGAATEALEMARELHQAQPIPPHIELLALALAVNGEFAEAATLQTELAELARQAGATAHAEQLEQVAQAFRDQRLPDPLWAMDDPMFSPPPPDPATPMRNYPAPNPY